ncbi:hypothetical protein [Paenibacillus alvei]|uniref:Peptidase M56 BlaR1 n=1 Tax=Paenibacillus alvei TaxID=44250 RepID=A0A383RFS3_PAEAL|nr:hypothetical protein [Paenibacillus alvei]SYX85501.1 conserved exported protein of unknown function [Paenibacillus alvei]
MKMTMKLAIATLSGFLLFGSMNLAAEAASSRSISDITLKTAAAKPKTMTEGEKLEKAERERINKLLEKNPEDTYILYVSNELTKVKGKAEVDMLGNSMPKFSKYEDYLKKAASLKEATLQKPANLPKGYVFSAAEIVGPYTADFAAELKAEAKKLNKQIYSKKLNWTTTNETKLEFKNGDNFIKISSRKPDAVDKKNYSQEYTYTSAEKMKKDNPYVGEKYLVNSLVWIQHGKLLSVHTNPKNPMTKEEMIKLAKTMVKK